ncbi:hypothetical protein [Candidatus Nitrosotenuis cloacae]|uniref:hypothetical protein n=1 Tax=Candidatus Nitrosotenuis cloacae TaxID=1603555 RepID=UPI00228254EE|nr:hypothetical protein [Candidatus Nitrosotenuis cloacae]
MNTTMFAAILSVGLLLFGVIATTHQMVPDAEAIKARGTYLKDVGTWKKDRAPSKVCGDELCSSLNDASVALRKGQISRGFAR